MQCTWQSSTWCARFEWLAWGAAVLLVAGCGTESTSNSGRVKRADGGLATADNTQVRHYTVDQIGEELGGYLPPLDKQRLHIAPPAGWHVEPRSSKYLARFVFDETHRSPLPRITVTAEDADFDEPVDLDEKSLGLFLDLLDSALSDSARKGMLEPMKPMVLGDVPCVRFVVGKVYRRGNKKIRGECQIVKTLHAGRIYTVALDVYRGTLLEHHNEAYVVVAGMEFLAGDSANGDMAKPGPDVDTDETATKP